MGVRINIDSLTFGYNRSVVLFEGLTASVIPRAPVPGRGFITVVMGSSGCGKTTLIKLLLGEELPQGGSVSIEPPDCRFSYLGQDPVLFEHLSVEENARYFSKLRSTRHQFDEIVYSRASQELGLSEVLRRPSITELSGGQRQRIALLRALSIRPSLLLLDEPCRGLDIPIRQEFLLYLRRLSDELGLAVVYVTHQHSEARLLADRILFLISPEVPGTVRVVAGSVADLISSPQHEAIALTFSDGPVNRIPAILSGNRLAIFGRKYLLTPGGSGSDSAKKEGVLLFRASQVQWNPTRGITCRRVGDTGQFLLAALDGGTDKGSIVIGPRTEEEVGELEIRGQVFFFLESGELVRSGQITEDR